MEIIAGNSLSIAVLAMGKGWLAVDKPAGVTVHNAPGRDICSLASAFILKNPAVSVQIDMDPDFGVNPVHRLDKETSGIILLAAIPEMFRFFSKQFESRQVTKHYIAILHGRLEDPPGSEPWGTWRWALAKASGGRLRPDGAGQRQTGATRYRVLDRSVHYTMVEIELLTVAPNGRQTTSAGISGLTALRCTRTRSHSCCRAEHRRNPSKPRPFQARCRICLKMTAEKRIYSTDFRAG